MRVTLDTNLFVYSLNETDRRRDAALAVVRRSSLAACVQPMQTYGECFAVLTGKYRRPAAEAAAAVAAFRALAREVVVAEEADFGEAMRAHAAYQIQFWDALIWAAAKRAGVRVLLTEDMQDGRDMEGVKILNPFNEANRAMIDLVLPPAEI